jgi:putative membrane protein
MHSDWMNWHWGFGFGHWIIGLLIWAAIIVAVAGLVRGLGGRRNEAPMSGSAMEILKARYARGEIDKEQYERMRSDLER